MNTYELPVSLDVSGIGYPIRSDFRAVLDILVATSDPDMEPWEKEEVMFQIIYPDYETIPRSAHQEALGKAVDFIDYTSSKKGKKPGPRTMDWKQDGAIIIPAVNKVAGKEVRSSEYLHWWTFLGYFMEIEDGMFSQVLAIRQKRAKKKKLEPWEKEFERNNIDLVRLEKRVSREERAQMDAIMKWL